MRTHDGRWPGPAFLLIAGCLTISARECAEDARDADARFHSLVARGPPAPPCWAVFFAHVEKAGGTSLVSHFTGLRDAHVFGKGTVVFQRSTSRTPAALRDVCSPTPGGWFDERTACTWEQLVRDLARGPSAARHERVFVEIPTMAYASAAGAVGGRASRDLLGGLLDAVRRVRAAWEPRGCRVLLVLLAREPLSHATSLFNAYVRHEQAIDPRSYGRSFSEWARAEHVHNPASRLLLGEPALRARVRMPTGRVRAMPTRFGATRAAVEAAAPALLARLGAFDLAAPLDAFDSLFFLLAERLGLCALRYAWRAAANRTAAEVARARGGGPARRPRPRLVAEASATRAPELSWELRALLLGKTLAVDAAVYRNVSARWAAELGALGPDARKRLGEYKALMRIVRREEGIVLPLGVAPARTRAERDAARALARARLEAAAASTASASPRTKEH